MKNKLKEIRMKEYMLSQREFAKFLNIKATTYCNWENGLSNPPLEKALEISKKLNRDIKNIWYLD